MRGERAPAAVPAGEDRNTVEETSEQDRLAADLQCLRDLLEEDRVEQARRFVQELEQRWPESERVRHYAHVLAPPKVLPRPDIPPRSREREWKWLAEHGHEYPGCWLAVHEDRLIAADPDQRAVVAKAREILGEEGALLFQQPGEPKPR
jgi:hypothetical protein